jgi:Helix-turn-helix domain
MSIRIMTQVWERSQHKGSELLLMLAIADNANDRGLAYPSLNTLAKKTRITRRNVIFLVKKLIRSGELRVEVGRGPGRTNIYHVDIVDIEDGENFSPRMKSRGKNQRQLDGEIATSPEPTTQTNITLTREQLKRPGLTPGSKIWDLLTGKIGPDAPF